MYVYILEFLYIIIEKAKILLINFSVKIIKNCFNNKKIIKLLCQL